jgi:threonylcarbamoyladenosine tRNA methylthiotransferase MtaB
MDEVNHTVAGGAQEVVLSGVQLSAYGRDLDEDLNLISLVEAVLAHTDIPRVRLSSLEPWSLPDRFFELWQNERLCRHLHLPLQSGCSTTLRRMGRPITPAAFADLVDSARSSIPDLGLTTDLIAGFPGETDAEFSQSLAFVTRMGFSSAHVFTYSPRPGTAAVRLPDQVQPQVARQRSAKLREEVARSQHEFLQRHIGETLTVLWESSIRTSGGQWEHVGLSDNYLRVSAMAPSNMHNRLSQVVPEKIEGITLQSIIPEEH